VPFEELEFKRPVFEFLSERAIDKELNKARSLGAEHGRAGVPGPDHPDAMQANAYSDEGERLLGQISRDWHEVNRVLRGEWCRLREVLGDREKQVPAAQAAVQGAQKRVDDKRKLHEKQLAAARAARPGTRHRIGRVAYALGLLAVFLVDVPLNAAVFQIFGENQLATWLLAGLIGILVVPGAHLLGTQIRNGFPDRVISAAALGVPLIFIIAVASMRVMYLEDTETDVGGPLGVFLFIAFNLAVFGSAVFLSYLRHDPYEVAIEEAAAELAQAKKELGVEEAALTRLQDLLTLIRGRIAEVRAFGEEELSKAKDWAAAERNYYEQLIDEYLMANQVARDRPQDVIPGIEASKRKKPSTPPDLEQTALLKWTCGEGEPTESA
jgi:hypothetical protein